MFSTEPDLSVAYVTIFLLQLRQTNVVYLWQFAMGAKGPTGRDLSQLISQANMMDARCEAQRRDLIKSASDLVIVAQHADTGWW
jgi:hypothetical protein